MACRESVVQLEHAGETVAVRRQVALYRSSDGEAVGQVVFHPPADRAARPVYRAGRLARPSDLLGLMSDPGAEACFAVSRAPAFIKRSPPPVPGFATQAAPAGMTNSPAPAAEAAPTLEPPATR